METSKKIERINQILKIYFASPSSPQRVRAKSLMPLFIEQGLFNEKNFQDGLELRNLLRDLDRKNELFSIPYVEPERKRVKTNWYFKKV